MGATTLQTNQFNDLFLVDGRNLKVIGGAQACLQSIAQATMMRTTEDVYNTTKGIDYFGLVFSQQPDYDGIRTAITTAILAVPDVVSIESLDISIVNGSLSFQAQVNTTYGQLPVRV